MTGRMGSVIVTPTLKTNVIKIKQYDTGRFIKMNNDKCTGHVRGLILGFEMMGSGDDLKRIKELKFKESIENPYQSQEKRIRLTTTPPRPSARLGRQGTWASEH